MGEKTYIPDGGLGAVHYSERGTHTEKYKLLAARFRKEGLDFYGHITMNPITGEIKAISEYGTLALKYLKEKKLNPLADKPK